MAILGLSGRLYVRARAKLLSWDDAFIVLAMVCNERMLLRIDTDNGEDIYDRGVHNSMPDA